MLFGDRHLQHASSVVDDLYHVPVTKIDQEDLSIRVPDPGTV
jgi:hypothetical protein